MKQEDYATFTKMSDAELLDFVTETQASQRGHLARHILASRQHDTMKKATIYAAVAAGLSALGTIIQAVMAIMAYAHPPH
ncbi:hypothetical protein [Klebsiella pneumoniae]|uniref:hypothetical protein n=1 Tax=Klebsiella pneumoniae TaxID=573 RepID=UPI001E409CC7|nr:hypothetical protein [Klebsiella pneumoniae]